MGGRVRESERERESKRESAKREGNRREHWDNNIWNIKGYSERKVANRAESNYLFANPIAAWLAVVVIYLRCNLLQDAFHVRPACTGNFSRGYEFVALTAPDPPGMIEGPLRAPSSPPETPQPTNRIPCETEVNNATTLARIASEIIQTFSSSSFILRVVSL